MKAKDEITATQLPAKAQKDRYTSAVHQVALRTLHEVFEADRAGKIHSIALTVGVNRIAPATGKPEYVPLAVAAADRDTFNTFDLANVSPRPPSTTSGPQCRSHRSTCRRRHQPRCEAAEPVTRFNPPPGWPQPPAGWVPPAGWKPDPSWPPMPEGWHLWLHDALISQRHHHQPPDVACGFRPHRPSRASRPVRPPGPKTAHRRHSRLPDRRRIRDCSRRIADLRGSAWQPAGAEATSLS